MTPQDELMEILGRVAGVAGMGEIAVEHNNSGKLCKLAEYLEHYARHIKRLAGEIAQERLGNAA